MSRGKSNSSEDSTLFKRIQNYKCLGIIETASSNISEERFMKVRSEIIKRTKSLCKGINGHAMSAINNHIVV